MFAFSVFDPHDTGYANRNKLKDHLTKIGDPLEEEEAEEWLSLVQVYARIFSNNCSILTPIVCKLDAEEIQIKNML